MEERVVDPVLAGFLASLAAGLAIGVGALPALATKKASDRLLDALLGCCLGHDRGLDVRLARRRPNHTLLGFFFGVVFLDGANMLIPHWHRLRGLEGPAAPIRRVWLLLLAMSIHNIPEGLAVGIRFGQDDLSAGFVIAMGIALQNLPEGLAIAFPMIREGYSRMRALVYAMLAGARGTGLGSCWGYIGDRGQVTLADRFGVRRGGPCSTWCFKKSSLKIIAVDINVKPLSARSSACSQW